MPRDKCEMSVVACVPAIYRVLARKGTDYIDCFVVSRRNQLGATRHDTNREEVGSRRRP